MNTFRTSITLARPLWKSVSLILLFNALLRAWLLIKPGTHGQFVAVDNLGQAVGAFLGVLLCVVSIGRAWQRHVTSSENMPATHVPRLWVPILLGFAVLGELIGQCIWTYYEQILHQVSPFPSWSDAGYLSAYPFLLLAVLLLPTRPLSLAARSRVLADGLMIMIAVITFSWYFFSRNHRRCSFSMAFSSTICACPCRWCAGPLYAVSRNTGCQPTAWYLYWWGCTRRTGLVTPGLCHPGDSHVRKANAETE